MNLHVLDYDGNILDCANLAALCALAHFRYPAVTVIGTDIHVVRSLIDDRIVPYTLHLNLAFN